MAAPAIEDEFEASYADEPPDMYAPAAPAAAPAAGPLVRYELALSANAAAHAAPAIEGYLGLSLGDLSARILAEGDSYNAHLLLGAWFQKAQEAYDLTDDPQDKRDLRLAIEAKASRYQHTLRPVGSAPAAPDEDPPMSDEEIPFDDELMLDDEAAPAPAAAPYLFPDGASVTWSWDGETEIQTGVIESHLPAEDGTWLANLHLGDGTDTQISEAFLSLAEAAEPELAPEPAEAEAPAPAVAPMPNPAPAAKPKAAITQTTQIKYDPTAEPFLPGQATLNLHLMIEPIGADGLRRYTCAITSHSLPPRLEAGVLSPHSWSLMQLKLAEYDQAIATRQAELTKKATPAQIVSHTRPAPKPAPHVSKAAAKKAAAKTKGQTAPTKPTPKPRPTPQKGGTQSMFD